MKAKQNVERREAYLTKRILLLCAKKAIRAAAAESMAVQGFAVIAKDGWLIKKYADGEIEKLSRLEVIKRPSKIVLD